MILANDKQYAERDCYDLEGNLKYSADFDQIRPFYNGLALAKSYRARSNGTAKNSFADHAAGYFNYIDHDGKPAILCDYTNGRDFHDGYAAVKKGEKWRLIDRAEQVAVPFDYPVAKNKSILRQPIAKNAIGQEQQDAWSSVVRIGESTYAPTHNSLCD